MSGKVTGTQAFLAASGGIPMKEAIQDNQPIGDYWVRKNAYISAGGGPMTFAIQLPRTPSFFFYAAHNSAVVYANDADRALWTPQQIVVRGTISTNVDLIVG